MQGWMGACSVFFTQSPSFLAQQCRKLFALREIPSDNQICNVLDPLTAEPLNRCDRGIFQEGEQAELVERRRSFGQQIWVVIDGTEYFSSQTIHCEQCSQRVLKKGRPSMIPVR